MIIGNKSFDLENHFYMMGILNVTPDSFSDGGCFSDVESALRQAGKLVSDGADIIDVGGESTRPGYQFVSSSEEMERVCPVIEAMKREFDVPVSLDTYKADVAKAGILAGADLINDIWGLKWDGNMAEVIAGYGVACCLMHNRKNAGYRNLMEDILADLQESTDMALAAGIDADRIIIDPGIGFAKDVQENLRVLKNLSMLHSLGFPILLGASRKSVIGVTLDLPVGQREEGTVAASVMGRVAGCSIFRVHDVKANLRGLQMAEAILKAEE